MKKNYIFTLLLTLCFSGLSFGQGSETFTGVTLPGSYSDDSFTGSGGITWTYLASRDANGDNNGSGISLPALMLRRASSGSKVTSSTISGGIGDFSVKLYKGFTSSGDRQVELFINGVSKGTSTPFDDFDEHVFTVSGLNISGDVIIELVNTTAKQVIVDDITWTALSVEPALTFGTPSDNQVFPAGTTTIPITFIYDNFNLSGDNGSEETDNTGDGYITGTVQKSGGDIESGSFFSNSESATVEDANNGDVYNITIELVDNSGVSLSPKVEATITFSIEFPCDLVLGDMATTCDAVTSGTDTFSGTIAFTGGNSGTVYTINTPSGVTVGGDNPDTTAAGTMTFTGMTEGTDAIINIMGDATSSCNLDSNLVTPVCLSLPIADDFTYPDGSLVDNPLWVNNGGTMGDLMVVSGQALIQHGTPSEDANLKFIPVTGNIYYALDFTVVDPGSPISGTDTEYFAHFKDTGSAFRARLDVVSPSAAGDFSVGISTKESTADATWATDLSYGTSYRVTVKYDQDNNIAQLWIDAAVEGGTSILGTDESDPGDSMVAFGLRQSDSELNEGVLVDNLRIATTFAATTLSIERNAIEGFATYPNPVSDNSFTITTSSNSKKELAIFNVLGKKVLSSSFSGVKSNVDVSTISSGVYILKVTEDGKTATKKLVIR